jgi:hypothetical protein
MKPHRAIMLIAIPVLAMVATVAYLRLQSPETAGRDTGTAADQRCVLCQRVRRDGLSFPMISGEHRPQTKRQR